MQALQLQVGFRCCFPSLLSNVIFQTRSTLAILRLMTRSGMLHLTAHPSRLFNNPLPFLRLSPGISEGSSVHTMSFARCLNCRLTRNPSSSHSSIPSRTSMTLPRLTTMPHLVTSRCTLIKEPSRLVLVYTDGASCPVNSLTGTGRSLVWTRRR